MKMISFAVKKGGVGKTTLCKNIAYKLALENKKILLIDLDPQATLSMQMIDDQIKVNNTLIKVIPSPDMIKLDKIIQKTKYKNIDIILGGESLNKSSDVIKNFYDEKDRFLIAEYIYKENEYIFDSYDYVLIDYPPTINDLALNFLILSDLIIIPVNDGLGSFKGLIDLKNTLNYICQKEQRKIGKILITLNNIKSDNNTQQINNEFMKINLQNYYQNQLLNILNQLLTLKII